MTCHQQSACTFRQRIKTQWTTTTQDGRFQTRIHKRTVKLAWWTANWLLTIALLGFGPQFLWDKSASLTLAGFGLCLLAAVGTGKFDPGLPLAFRAARLFGLRIEDIFLDNGSTPASGAIESSNP